MKSLYGRRLPVLAVLVLMLVVSGGSGLAFLSAQSNPAGTMSALDLFRMVNQTVVRSQEKMVLMNNAGALNKLGQETVSGDVSGTVSYDAKVKGLGGRVLMQYENYCDYKGGVILTGGMNTSASMTMKGTMDGTVQITGSVSGAVCYDNVKIVDGDVGGGYYMVSVNGGTFEKIDWQYALEGRERRSE